MSSVGRSILVLNGQLKRGMLNPLVGLDSASSNPGIPSVHFLPQSFSVIKA